MTTAAIMDVVGASRAVGCVVEMAAEISHPRHERHIVPDTWVNTFRVNTFRFFCGREVWMRFAGSGADERCVPGFRHIRIPAGFLRRTQRA